MLIFLRFTFALLITFIFVTCSSIETKEGGLPFYEVRPLPGPEAFETRATFERASLWITSEAQSKNGSPEIRLEFRNQGADRITIRCDLIKIHNENRSKSCGVLVKNESGEEERSVTLLKRDRRILTITPLDEEIFALAPFVLELRGIRDSRGDGGFDFDLIARERPDPDPDQAVAKLPLKKKDQPRRPIYEGVREPPAREEKKQ